MTRYRPGRGHRRGDNRCRVGRSGLVPGPVQLRPPAPGVARCDDGLGGAEQKEPADDGSVVFHGRQCSREVDFSLYKRMPAGASRTAWGGRPTCRLSGSRRRSGCVPAEPYPPLKQPEMLSAASHLTRGTSHYSTFDRTTTLNSFVLSFSRASASRKRRTGFQRTRPWPWSGGYGLTWKRRTDAGPLLVRGAATASIRSSGINRPVRACGAVGQRARRVGAGGVSGT